MSAQVAGSYANLEQEVAARTVELQAALQERARQAHDLTLALERVEQKDREIQALSIPVVPLLRDTFVLPIVGVLDANRAYHLTNVLLSTIASHQARVVIVDVTGLAFIDEVVARLLLKAASAVSLLGAEIILVGVRPEVAQTLVALGISLDGLKTLGNLQAAVLETLHQTQVLSRNSTKVTPLNT